MPKAWPDSRQPAPATPDSLGEATGRKVRPMNRLTGLKRLEWLAVWFSRLGITADTATMMAIGFWALYGLVSQLGGCAL